MRAFKCSECHETLYVTADEEVDALELGRKIEAHEPTCTKLEEAYWTDFETKDHR